MNKISLTSNAILMIALSLVTLFLFKQCQTNSSKEAEISRLDNNLRASRDTLKTFVNVNGNLQSEISGYIFDAKKDKKQIQLLVGENVKLKGLIAAGSGHAGSVTGGSIASNIIKSTDSTGVIKLADSIIYDATNYMKFYSSTPYKLSIKRTSIVKGKDTSYLYMPVLATGLSTYRSETALDLNFRFQFEQGQLKVKVETPNKSIIFSSLTGGTMSGKDLPKELTMSSRKEWGLGYSMGIGLGYQPFTNQMMPVIYLGIGINHTSKKTQF